MESNLGLREKGVQAFRLVAHDSCWAMALPLGQEQPAGRVWYCPAVVEKKGPRQAMNRGP